MAQYNHTNTGAVIDSAVDAVELAKAASSTDNTAGRLLKVGDAGILRQDLQTSTLNSSGYPTQFHRIDTADPENPFGGGVPNLHIQHQSGATPASIDVAFDLGTSRIKFRRILGATVSDWLDIATSENNSLIEFGSNANGSFTKFPDGTLICYANITNPSKAMTSPFIGGFRSDANVWSYPSSFISTPSISGITDNASAVSISLLSATSSSSASFVYSSFDSQAAADRFVSITAIGRWK